MNYQQLQNIYKILGLLALLSVVTMSCGVNDINETNDIDLYVSIPDVQFEQLLIDQGIDSEGIADNKLLRADAETITHLNLNWSGGQPAIIDMTGIDAFENLTTLTAARQELEQIDLRFNTMLDTLHLPGNFLGEINLSQNTRLVDVNLGTNELVMVQGLSALQSLKALDLSWNYLQEMSIENPSVEILFLNLNELENLDLSQAVNLTSLIVTSNKLTDISLNTNTKLETVVMSDNAIQSVDLSNNRELNYFYASSNALKNLDVSSNSKLIDLRVDRNPELTCIKIKSGQEIPSVVVSENQELNTECG